MKSYKEFNAIYVHREYVDMRKSINGLSVIAQESMKLDVFSISSIFVFCNKRRNRLKILYWDKTGFALWFKRLEEAKSPWPKLLEKDVIDLALSDLEMLLEGINIWTRFEKVHFEKIV